MKRIASAPPRRHQSMVFDSDDEFEVYDYKSRQGGRPSDSRKTSKPKSSHGRSADDGATEQTITPETGSTSSDEVADEDAPHPFYNYSTEKADTHADAKLIYQRHRMDTKSGDPELGSPLWLARSTTLPATQTDGDALGRSLGTASHEAGFDHQRDNVVPIQPVRSREAFPTLQAHVKDIQQHTPHDPYLLADAAARDHRHHPGLPHEFKDSLLANQGVHGAGAGIGLGHGADGFAQDEGSIVSEVVAICEKIKTVLDMRLKFMRASLQCPGDNPKDDESWNIYPPPPKQVWGDNKSLAPPTQEHHPTSASSSLYMNGPLPSTTNWASTASLEGSERPSKSPTATKNRKMGKDIGSDFDFNECEIPRKEPHGLQFAFNSEGVYQVFGDDIMKPLVQVPSLREYYVALDTIQEIASDGPAKSFAYRRLQYLEGRYNLYTLLNEYEEVADTKKVPHRDFYNVRKVDTHVHHSACMNQKHLLRFIKSKMKKCPDEVVISRDGQQLTLAEVFQSINLTAYDLSIDTLDMHAHTDSFHRFDKFNLKYNPIGQSRLRDIFLKTDNHINGRYLADITKEVIEDLESSKYQMVEWRVSIYGRNVKEWDTLAGWVVDNKLFSHNVRWLVQIPRLYNVYKANKTVNNFEEMLYNLFQPLFEVTQDPSTHPKLYIFLQRVIGFDSVDDESKVERRLYRKYPAPREWDTKQNPPYGYWIYFLFANMASLNHWRQRRGMNTFLLRPHCGEAGDVDHLASAALCCHSISHGITLRKAPLLQYVFYLDQIGIAMSPLSNNALFLTYDRNPFISYFKKGMNVSLSTDDPLQFAFTKEPLIEEYSVAAQIYKLSAVDMCELAKHSVDQCGFELSLKQRWLGKYCYLPGRLGNDVAKCNVPDVREAFRHETLKAEHSFIAKYTPSYCHLERCTPSLPDALLNNAYRGSLDNSDTPSTPIGDIYRALESPKHFYASVADALPPAQTQRLPTPRTAGDILGINSTGRDAASGTQHSASRASNSPEQRQGEQQQHRRTLSSSSASFPASTTGATAYVGNGHMDASEPRAFPGVVHQRERRRSLRVGSNTPGATSSVLGGPPPASDDGVKDQIGGSRGSFEHLKRGMAGLQVAEEDTDTMNDWRRSDNSSDCEESDED